MTRRDQRRDVGSGRGGGGASSGHGNQYSDWGYLGGSAGDGHQNGGGTGRHSQPSVLEDLMRRKGVDEAWDALEDMQRQGLTTDRFTISRMLMKTVSDGRGRGNSERVYRGVALVERFIRMQPEEADEILFNALLDTCCRIKDLARLESTIQRMQELQVQASHVTLGILVKAYGQAGDISRVLKVWEEMSEQRRQANAVTYGCMLDACVRCGQMGKAVEIFQDMKTRRKHRNTILYTTLIKGYGQAKDLPNALALFKEMKDEGVPYNTITYNSIIDVCIKCSDVQNAELLLREMMAPGSCSEPDLITYSTLLKGYCHVGDLDKSLQVAETIRVCGLTCDELVFNTLMDGCVKANDFSAGIGLFAEMAQSGMMPSSITFSILVRLYQRNGYKGDAFEAVAQLYQHHGLERPSGVGGRYKGGGRRNRKAQQRAQEAGDAASRHTGFSEHQGAAAHEGDAFAGSSGPAYDPWMMPSDGCAPDMGLGFGCSSPAALHGDMAYMQPGMGMQSPFPATAGPDMQTLSTQPLYGMPPMSPQGFPLGTGPALPTSMQPSMAPWGMPAGQATGSILSTTAPSMKPHLGAQASQTPVPQELYSRGGYGRGIDDGRSGMMPGPGPPLAGVPWGGALPDMQCLAAPASTYGGSDAAYATDRHGQQGTG